MFGLLLLLLTVMVWVCLAVSKFASEMAANIFTLAWRFDVAEWTEFGRASP